jgi:hypothetical protein
MGERAGNVKLKGCGMRADGREDWAGMPPTAQQRWMYAIRNARDDVIQK